MFYIDDAQKAQLDPVWWRKRLNSSILRKMRKGSQKHTDIGNEKKADLLKALTKLQKARNGSDMELLRQEAGRVYQMLNVICGIAREANDMNFYAAANECQIMARKLADHGEDTQRQVEFDTAAAEGRDDNYTNNTKEKLADYQNI